MVDIGRSNHHAIFAIRYQSCDIEIDQVSKNKFSIRMQLDGGPSDSWWETDEQTYPTLNDAIRAVMDVVLINIDCELYA